MSDCSLMMAFRNMQLVDLAVPSSLNHPGVIRATRGHGGGNPSMRTQQRVLWDMFVSWICPLNQDEVGETSLEEGSLYVGACSPKGRMLRGNTSVPTIKNL